MSYIPTHVPIIMHGFSLFIVLLQQLQCFQDAYSLIVMDFYQITKFHLLKGHKMMMFSRLSGRRRNPHIKGGVLGWVKPKIFSLSRNVCSLCRVSLSIDFSVIHKVHKTKTAKSTLCRTKKRALGSLAVFTNHHAHDQNQQQDRRQELCSTAVTECSHSLIFWMQELQTYIRILPGFPNRKGTAKE